LSDCIDTLQCFVDQCASGTHKCQNGRTCILNENWSYNCTNCIDFYMSNDEPFKCTPSTNLIIIISCSVAFILIIIMIIIILIILRKKNQKLDLYLPHNWLWEPVYLKKFRFKKSITDPIYHFKHVDSNDVDSKEYKLFNYLKEILKFEDIMIQNITIVSCRTLAQNMSNYRKIMKERMRSDSELFKRDNWMEKSNFLFRSRTLDHFQRQIFLFEWNFNLDIKDCPILAVAHATSMKKATNIVVSGFASLSTLDVGWYGKGIYFSSSAMYTLPYCLSEPDPCIIICFLLPGNPFPIIENPRSDSDTFIGLPITPGYQCHYVVTNISGLPLSTEINFASSRKFNEIVIDQEAQVVPIFLVELDTSNFQELAELYKREVTKEKEDLESISLIEQVDCSISRENELVLLGDTSSQFEN